MKPSRCLLFDANIVIALFQFRLWQEVVSRYTKSFRDEQRARGFEDKLSGMGLK